jgi:predicted GIY-YIG superfamily endonuclease
MQTTQEREPQQTAKCAYSIPCECGRSYIGETATPLTVRLREHRQNPKDDFVE